jgi:DNA helicase-2/ATP-dependent DNA helicase PcrA
MRIQLRMPTAEILSQLNPEQAAAASHDPAGPPLLIIAGAGTGKTHTLATRLAWLVDRGADPRRVLLLTFSRRAAGEMARRAGRLLHQSRGLPASAPPPALPWCGTFHSVAVRLLRDEAAHLGLSAGFTVLDRADAQDLLAQLRQELGLDGREHRLPLAATCAAILSRCLNTRTRVKDAVATQWPWCMGHEDDLKRLFDAYADAKRQQHSMDFDDLLLAWWHLMQQPMLATRICGRFDHVLVDEVQDINRLQADILKALKPQGAGLTAVGDDAQSIYAFRGADVRHVLDFPQRFDPPAAVHLLTQNYRSTPELLAASNATIALAQERFPKQLWSQRATGCKPRFLTVEDEAAQAHGVADGVLRARETGLKLMRQAVLFRTGTHSLALEMELTRRGIPFVKYGGLKFMEAAHVKDVLAVLRWADNPASRLSMLRAARLVPGMGPASVRRLLDHAGPVESFKPPTAAAEAWAPLLSLLQHLRSSDARWPADLQQAIDWYQPHLERLHADARVRRADLDQLAAIAPTHKSRERFVTDLTLDPPAASSDVSGPPHRDEDYLILSTLHSAKGQEWNAVHILNVVDGCMPADIATGSAAETEEERRLLYVGMTRARDELTLWAPQRFHVTQQRPLGSRHLYALRSRFLSDSVMQHFDTAAPEKSADLVHQEVPPTAALREPASATALLDLHAALRSGIQAL